MDISTQCPARNPNARDPEPDQCLQDAGHDGPHEDATGSAWDEGSPT